MYKLRIRDISFDCGCFELPKLCCRALLGDWCIYMYQLWVGDISSWHGIFDLRELRRGYLFGHYRCISISKLREMSSGSIFHFWGEHMYELFDRLLPIKYRFVDV